MDNKKTLFLSYSWNDATIADKIDEAFQPTGVQVKRDIRGIKYKDSIKLYMSQIRDTDFVLLIISDSFIKSSNCMYEVLEILNVLEPRIKSCTHDLDSQAVSNAFYGMQGMTSDHIEVRTILSTLVAKLHTCQVDLDYKGIGNALYGLQGMGNSSETLLVLSYLFENLIKLQKKTNNFELLRLYAISSESICATAICSSLVPSLK